MLLHALKSNFARDKTGACMEVKKFMIENRGCLDSDITEYHSGENEILFVGHFKIRKFELKKDNPITQSTIKWLYYCQFKEQIEAVRNLKPEDLVTYYGELSIRESNIGGEFVYAIHITNITSAFTPNGEEPTDAPF